jgi:multicomponent Na+:H+ antiporter subunit E
MRILVQTGLPALMRSIVTRVASFGLLWWALVDGVFYGLWLAAVFVGAATVASFMLVPANRGPWRVGALVCFLAFFAHQSVIGGIDVSRRALDPKLPIAPAFVQYQLRITHPPAIVLLVDTVSLLPGTVGSRLEGQSLTVHALDSRLPVARTIQRLELHVAALFGIAPVAS